jgi:enoyl-CoA hydratase
MIDTVLTPVEGRVGRLRLNRPAALHALSTDMCHALVDTLLAWRADEAIELVLLDHAAGRGFCAGGDVRAAAIHAGVDGAAARSFFRIEYQLNHLLFVYAKPVVAMMDGVVMGGGVGISLPARYRVATERTLFAMPEATIGLFPDAGAGWHLSRLPGRIGQYLALTAGRLGGAEAHALGLATHYIPSERVDEVKEALIADPRAIASVLDAASIIPQEAGILLRREEIDRLFAGETLEEIEAALAADGSDWARETLSVVRTKSPLSCKVALRLLREGALRTDFADEMRTEYAVVSHVCLRHDFIEGVRALLVDRDNRPHWDPATAKGVTDHMIDTIFAPLSDEDAWEPVRL